MSECMQIAFLGAESAGKRSLIEKMLSTHSGDSNSEEFPNQIISLPEIQKAFVIMDTDDLHNFPSMRRVTIQMAKVFVLVFAVDNEKSFSVIEKYYDDIMEIKTGSDETIDINVPIVVVANKSDINKNEEVDTRNMKKKVIEQWGRKYIEVSTNSDSDAELVLKAMQDEIARSLNLKSRRSSLVKRMKIKLKAVSSFNKGQITLDDN